MDNELDNAVTRAHDAMRVEMEKATNQAEQDAVAAKFEPIIEEAEKAEQARLEKQFEEENERLHKEQRAYADAITEKENEVRDKYAMFLDLTDSSLEHSFDGDADEFEFNHGGLKLAGDCSVTFAAKSLFSGTVDVMIDVSKVRGAWDKGDSFSLAIGSQIVFHIKDETPKAEKIVLQADIEAFESIQLIVQNNKSGGDGAGGAESITINSIYIRPI